MSTCNYNEELKLIESKLKTITDDELLLFEDTIHDFIDTMIFHEKRRRVR